MSGWTYTTTGLVSDLRVFRPVKIVKNKPAWIIIHLLFGFWIFLAGDEQSLEVGKENLLKYC